jgi:hypothetical protein
LHINKTEITRRQSEQTKIFKISYYIIPKVLKNEMIKIIEVRCTLSIDYRQCISVSLTCMKHAWWTGGTKEWIPFRILCTLCTLFQRLNTSRVLNLCQLKVHDNNRWTTSQVRLKSRIIAPRKLYMSQIVYRK